jgi:hypothetical protein
LGERLLCKQEVVGSIPSGSTRLAVAGSRIMWSEPVRPIDRRAIRRCVLAACASRSHTL